MAFFYWFVITLSLNSFFFFADCVESVKFFKSVED